MVERILAMSLVLAAWGGLSYAFCGLGLWVRRAFLAPPAEAGALFRCFWVGFALFLAWLQVLHLAAPLAAWGVVPPLLLGGVGFFLFGRPSVLAWGRTIPTPRLLFLCLPLILLWVANRAIGLSLNADIDFYHRATVMWFSNHPLLHGFGNVHLWLGYNQSAFLYAAALNALPGGIAAEHIANSLLWVVALLQAAWAMRSLATQPDAGTPSTLFLACAAFPLVLFLFSGHLTGYSPEMYLFLAVFVVGAELLALWFPQTRASAPEDRFRLFALVLVACIAITMKISAIPFFSLSILAALFAYARSVPSWRERAGGVALAAGGGVLVLGVWMYRGILTSGYPLYPSTTLPFPVPWLVPVERVAWLRGFLTWAAREGFGLVPTPRTGGSLWQWDWLPIWFAYHIRSGWSWALGWLPLAGTLLLLLGGRRRRADSVAPPAPRAHVDTEARSGWIVLLIPAIALAGWFATGPRFLYLGSILWGACGFAFAVSGIATQAWGRRLMPHLPAALLLFSLALIGIYSVRHPLRSLPVVFMQTTERGFYAPPAPLRWDAIKLDGVTFHCPLPVYDPAWHVALWRAPHPALPAKAVTLSFRLRAPGDLGAGFLPDAPKPDLVPREAGGTR